MGTAVAAARAGYFVGVRRGRPPGGARAGLQTRGGGRAEQGVGFARAGRRGRPGRLQPGPAASPTASRARTLSSWPRALCGLCPLPGTCLSPQHPGRRVRRARRVLPPEREPGRACPGFCSSFVRGFLWRHLSESWTGFVYTGVLVRATWWLFPRGLRGALLSLDEAAFVPSSKGESGCILVQSLRACGPLQALGEAGPEPRATPDPHLSRPFHEGSRLP